MAMAGGIGAAVMYGLMLNRINKDMEAYNEIVPDKRVSNPEEVKKLCYGDHKKHKTELVEVNAHIKAGEEIVRVGQGLAEVRKMMKGPQLDPMLKLRQTFGGEISEEEKSEALKKIEKDTVPIEVKRAIIAHWWTELMKLFVPWGLVLPEEIDHVKDPCFRLVGPEVREAVLRMEVYKYKEGYESFKKAFEESMERKTEDFKKHLDEREAWRTEKEELLKAYEDLKAEKNAIEANADDETPDA